MAGIVKVDSAFSLPDHMRDRPLAWPTPAPPGGPAPLNSLREALCLRAPQEAGRRPFAAPQAMLSLLHSDTRLSPNLLGPHQGRPPLGRSPQPWACPRQLGFSAQLASALGPNEAGRREGLAAWPQSLLLFPAALTLALGPQCRKAGLAVDSREPQGSRGPAYQGPVRVVCLA